MITLQIDNIQSWHIWKFLSLIAPALNYLQFKLNLNFIDLLEPHPQHIVHLVVLYSWLTNEYGSNQHTIHKSK